MKALLNLSYKMTLLLVFRIAKPILNLLHK